MAFYLRRLYEVDRDQAVVCADGTAAVAESGSASLDGSDTVDKATLLAKLQELEDAINAAVLS